MFHAQRCINGVKHKRFNKEELEVDRDKTVSDCEKKDVWVCLFTESLYPVSTQPCHTLLPRLITSEINANHHSRT